ncbi:flippase-like domain-containing protein, partial [bacterium]|nr:flippase-like domain-containing protein [bacterium]
MKKPFLFLVSLLIGISLFTWVISFIGWQEIKNTFLGFSSWKGLVVFLLSLLIAILGSLKWQIILRGKKIKVSFFELFKYYLAGFSISFFAPVFLGVGGFFSTYLLKKKHSIDWLKGVSSLIIDRISEWTTNLLVIFTGILIFLYKIGPLPRKLTLIFGITFLFFSI